MTGLISGGVVIVVSSVVKHMVSVVSLLGVLVGGSRGSDVNVGSNSDNGGGSTSKSKEAWERAVISSLLNCPNKCNEN